ncbi:ABC transporter substrate-binding protein [Paenibacillus thalictri]|uniref:Thiamine pyrimidine synthase n=1 Tax=Paenibacillus thalictri TaxID=2527873 RepID=A0A4Q9DHA5_9BACL|nr:ABC transporter substrate-binding protein [Paenibacillus thalictri]TBL69364.1 ABC transporter substrate-binding protein [Paenibacillus thalictri]
MKKWVSLVLAVMLITVLAACGSKPGNEAAPAPAAGGEKPKEVKKVTIQIDGAAVPYYAPLYVAKEQGFFKEQGLDVDFVYADAASIVKNVAADNVQFGFPNADAVITAKSQGIPIKVVHTTYQHGLGATIFKKSKGIKGPQDLKGKTVAVTSFGSPNYIQLQVLAEKSGFNVKDINTKIVGTGAIVNALVADEVDAITFSMLRTVELKNSGVDVEEIRSDDFLPSFGNVVVVSDKFLSSSKDTVTGFNKALNKSLDYIINGHAKEAIDMSIKKYAQSSEGKQDITEKIFNDVFIPYLWQSDLTKKDGYGAADMARWQAAIDTQKKYDIIKTDVKAEDLVVPNLK